ncbi:MAG: hypothetical protein QOG48_2227 [Verrucomicrobiota bacterium]
MAFTFPNVPRAWPFAGLCSGYLLLMFFNPVRVALRDGLRCLARYPRVWLTFVVLGLCYSAFQFATFAPVESANDFDLNQIASLPSWHWPRLKEVWTEVPLPALEGVAGIFDNATTTYPLSILAAVLVLMNWRGLPGALWTAMRKDYRISRYFIYFVLLLSALAAIAKAAVFFLLSHVSDPRFPQISASIDALAFIFEYLLGVYIQVYIITVCLVWVRGLSFNETSLFQFAARRFAYVLKWAGVVICVSMMFVRGPLLLAYFTNVPAVLDYLPYQRMLMSIFILAFACVQVSLALHNENLAQAIAAHFRFVRQNFTRFAWFVLICALHFIVILAFDAVARNAIANRIVALIVWKFAFVTMRGLVIGWLLASWVCLFRQSETRAHGQENWVRY